MGLFFFKTPSHRVFNYQPLYYNERKEILEQKIDKARKREAGEYVPGDTIRKGFRRLQYESKRSNKKNTAIRIVKIVTAAIILIVLWYFIDAIGLLFSAAN